MTADRQVIGVLYVFHWTFIYRELQVNLQLFTMEVLQTNQVLTQMV